MLIERALSVEVKMFDFYFEFVILSDLMIALQREL